MIEELRIRNLALIRSAQIRFAPGLNIITGETGAGKTILLHALSLIGGTKASSDMVGSDGEEAHVEVRFRDVMGKALNEVFEQAGIEDLGDEVFIKRSIGKDGRSRAYVNGSMVSIQTLSKLVSHLMTISGQFESQRLLRPENHLSILDEYLGLTGLREELNSEVDAHELLWEEVESLRGRLIRGSEEQELMEYALKEIQEAKIRPEEEGELLRERERLKHAADIKSALHEALRDLESDSGSVEERLFRVGRSLNRIKAHEPEAETLLNTLESIRAQVSDLIWEIKKLDLDVIVDPSRLEYVLERLELINRLKKKYGGSVEAILEYRDKLETKKADIEELRFRIAKAEQGLKEKEKRCFELATTLSEGRLQGAPKFEERIQEELSGLNMPHCRFKVVFKEKEAQGNGRLRWLKNGQDVVEFLISPNPGEELKPLAKIASGGELSRITLAIKALKVLEQKGETILFDEVDQGISGLSAEMVGKKIRELGRYQQVICITHLPQIAAQEAEHFLVEKLVEGNKTYTSIRRLSMEERVLELARMMGGTEITPTLISRVKEMLGLSAEEFY